MTNQRATADTTNRKDTEMFTWRIMLQITTPLVPIASTEHFVIAVNKAAMVVDDVETVVRLVSARKTVAGTKNHPYT